MPKISLIFRCLKWLIVILWKFANMQKSADFCKWWEKWKAHINWNMFLPYHAKNQPHFLCPKGLIVILWKFAKMQKSADFCIWWEIWKAHINTIMFLPYHAKYQHHFQVSKRTYSHFIKIRKYAKISWFLQMAGNLKSSYQLKFVFTLPCQKSASFSGVRKDL